MKVTQLMLSTATALVATMGVSTIAEAITIRHDRWDGHYQQIGSYFPSVGRLSINNSKNCSGTLIDPQWVLTAAHCTDALSFANFNIGQSNYSVIDNVIHEDWFRSGRNWWAGADIALVQLDRNVWNINPTPLFRSSNEVGELGIHVGFGQTGDGLTGSVYYNNVRKGAQNRIDAFGGQENRLLLTDFDAPWQSTNRIGSPFPENFEGSTAFGDSGGGLFIDHYVAGITSTGSDLYGNQDSRYGTLMLSTRVSSFQDWIDSVISGQTSASSGFSGSYSNNGNQGVFFAAEVASTSVPEPSSLLSLGIFSLFGLFGLAKKGKQEN